MAKKTQEVLTEEQLAILNAGYPVSDNTTRKTLPRFGMLSKDITEESGNGKNKTIKVIESAGTFYTEMDNGEVDENGKKIWTKTYLGEEVEVIIAFDRKQLRRYDKSLKKFISSSIYDRDDQVLPLYLDKQQIHKGTPAQLQALYPALTQKGKPTSDLKEEKLLYVIYKEELYQSNLSLSSKYSFLDYRKSVNPSSVVTTLGSLEETNGSNTYRKMTFKNKRLITPEEFDMVKASQDGLIEQVKNDAKYLIASKADSDLDMIADATKHLD